MARIRTVKPQFFRHRKLFLAEQESGLPLRVAFAGLWTCADRAGRFRWEPEELKLDCLPYDDVDFSRVLDALFTRGFVVRYASGGKLYGVVPGFKDHQLINNRESESILPEPPDNTEQLIEEANEVDASSTREARALSESKGKGRGKGREGERKGIDLGTRDTRPKEFFEKFKEEFPKREGAQPWKPAETKFLAIVRSGINPEEIISAARQCASDARRDKIYGTAFVPQAVTWLNQQRFADYLDAAESARRAEQALKSKFYAAAESEQMAAWDRHLTQLRGRGSVRDRNGGWFFESEWPPGYVAPASTELELPPAPQMRAMQ
jgi:hypothetical protein